MVKRYLAPNRRTIFIFIIIALASTAIPVGCGIKGPPRLPEVAAPSAVRNLSVALSGNDIVLSWTPARSDKANGESGYLVYRSAESVDEDECQGCPVLFERVGRISIETQDAATRKMMYQEVQMPRTRYRFKVVPLDAQGRLGPDSNIVRIITD